MKKLMIALMTTGLFSLGAVAQEPPPQDPPPEQQQQQPPEQQQQVPAFEELDVDGTGYIDRQQAGALPCLAQAFDEIETESDEGLNPQEYEQAVRQFCQ